MPTSQTITFELIYPDDVDPAKARADIRQWASAVAGTATLAPEVLRVIVSDVTTTPTAGEYIF